jgi:hypothetical protein
MDISLQIFLIFFSQLQNSLMQIDHISYLLLEKNASEITRAVL